MRTNDVFPSKFLKAEDDLFAEGEVTATIKAVELEKMGRGEEEKPVMYFKELAKGLVTNKTNWATCEKLFKSDDSNDWVGERVTLYVKEVESFGELVKGIRVKEQRPVADRQALIERFSKLYQRAVAAKIEGVENYVIDPKMPDDEIIKLGKELKSKVEAAEQF